MAWDSLAARPALFGARWGVPRARRVSRRASAIDHQNARPKGATNLRTLPVAYTFAASARPPAPGVGAGLPSLPLPLSRVQSERKFTCAEWLSASGYTASAGSLSSSMFVWLAVLHQHLVLVYQSACAAAAARMLRPRSVEGRGAQPERPAGRRRAAGALPAEQVLPCCCLHAWQAALV